MKTPAAASLTLRLALLFSLVALLTFGSVGSYLYHSLWVQLERRDDDELFGKSGALNHLVHQYASLHDIALGSQPFFDLLSGHDRMEIRIEDAAGNPILASRQHIAIPSDIRLADLPAGRRHSVQQLEHAHGKTPIVTRAITSETTLGDGQPVLIMVARATSERMRVLDEFSTDIRNSALFGSLLAALLGYLGVGRGLHPLRMMAAQAHAISASRLHTRIDLRAAPRELHEIATAFNAMLHRLHLSFQQLGQFSADLAHELRTPLNNLMLQTQVALGKPRPLPEYQALLGSNVEEYERLARMLDSMLFLARAENAHVAMQVRALDVRVEMLKVAAYFEGVADDAGVRLVVGAHGEIQADATLLRRAVSNLVANAIHHTPIGGVIGIGVCQRDGAGVVEVSNPGPGIAPELQERIFDRFFRADPARINTGGSSGLGLAIVRSIMQLHGGRAWVHSRPGEVTTFHLSFPALQSARSGQPE